MTRSKLQKVDPTKSGSVLSKIDELIVEAQDALIDAVAREQALADARRGTSAAGMAEKFPAMAQRQREQD
jgi:acyl-CoA reductase-like NAD-dependent aldehyde dehydrogenase